jgi:hypothetical protein
MPANTIDPGEFYMTQFHDPNGANHFPYQPLDDNHYTTMSDQHFESVYQCHVDVTRKTGDEYGATYYGASGQELGSGSAGLHNDGDRFVLTPPQGGLSWTSLVIIRTGEMGRAGTRGSRIDFESASDGNVGYNDPLTDLRFSTESRGADTRYPDASDPGGYCHVPDIEDTESYSIQAITCYYACTF